MEERSDVIISTTTLDLDIGLWLRAKEDSVAVSSYGRPKSSVVVMFLHTLPVRLLFSNVL